LSLFPEIHFPMNTKYNASKQSPQEKLIRKKKNNTKEAAKQGVTKKVLKNVSYVFLVVSILETYKIKLSVEFQYDNSNNVIRDISSLL